MKLSALIPGAACALVQATTTKPDTITTSITPKPRQTMTEKTLMTMRPPTGIPVKPDTRMK